MNHTNNSLPTDTPIDSVIPKEREITKIEVKRMRKALWIKQAEFAKIVGCATATIAAWEGWARPITWLSQKYLWEIMKRIDPIIEVQERCAREAGFVIDWTK